MLSLEVFFFNSFFGKVPFPEGVHVQAARIARPAVQLRVVTFRALENERRMAARAESHAI